MTLSGKHQRFIAKQDIETKGRFRSFANLRNVLLICWRFFARNHLKNMLAKIVAHHYFPKHSHRNPMYVWYIYLHENHKK